MKMTLLGTAARHSSRRGRVFRFCQRGLLLERLQLDCASPQVYYQPYPIRTVTSRIMGIPSPGPTGPTRTGIHCVIRVPGPALTTVINRL
jgi:hypothetical protein